MKYFNLLFALLLITKINLLHASVYLDHSELITAVNIYNGKMVKIQCRPIKIDRFGSSANCDSANGARIYVDANSFSPFHKKYLLERCVNSISQQCFICVEGIVSKEKNSITILRPKLYDDSWTGCTKNIMIKRDLVEELLN